MLEIKDLNLLKITKVKSWAIYFTYDNERYLLHGPSDGYESDITLYKKDTDDNGKYNLERVASILSSTDYFSRGYVGEMYHGKTYSSIDKERFVKLLISNKFATGIYNDEVDKVKNEVKRLKQENKHLDEIINKNRSRIRNLLDFKM